MATLKFNINNGLSNEYLMLDILLISRLSALFPSIKVKELSELLLCTFSPSITSDALKSIPDHKSVALNFPRIYAASATTRV